MYNSLSSKIERFLRGTDGPTTVEYAFILALVVLGCMTSLFILSDNTSNVFKNTAGQLEAETAKGAAK